MRRALLVSSLLLSISAFALGCGHSEAEWQKQLAAYNKLLDTQKQTEAENEQLSRNLDTAKTRVSRLEKELKAAGVDIGKLKEDLSQTSSTLAEQQRALSEYKERAAQLEKVKARFEALRSKLDALTKLGLAVNIRRNRMVISLPGDVLFDSGRETLKKEGQDILGKVASVIRSDATLQARDYQVAGHTDSRPLAGGIFRDNWGLSLMRAREVLLFLVGEKAGQLPVQHWSAAGFADMDPIADNETDEGRQKNRRCDLIVVPSVEEMLDLKAIAQ